MYTYYSQSPSSSQDELPECSNQNRHYQDMGDGIWDDDFNRWSRFPCARRTCPRHWQNYARRRYRSIRPYVQGNATWYHLVLYTRTRIVGRFPNLAKWVGKIRTKYPTAKLVSIKHRGRNADHIHVMMGLYDELPDITFIKQAWQSHFPNKRAEKFRNGFVYIRPHNNRLRLLYYCLGLSKRRKRKKPPWQGLTGQAITVHRQRKKCTTGYDMSGNGINSGSGPIATIPSVTNMATGIYTSERIPPKTSTAHNPP